MKKNLINLAKEFAITGHNSINHRRKYTQEPYYYHLERVASIVAKVTDNEEIIAAAWLHDILEDVAPQNSNYNETHIAKMFGRRVLQLVLEVTDISTLADGNRAKRKEIDRQHLSKASCEGKTIKLADLIDNYIDISKNDPRFAKVFKQEIELTLPMLNSGNQSLYSQLVQLISEDASYKI